MISRDDRIATGASAACIDPQVAEIGAEAAVTWGEPGSGRSKPTVERQRQVDVRAAAQPRPLPAVKRKTCQSQT